MRLPRPWSLLVIPLLFVALGCSKPRFVYEEDPAFRISSFKSVAPDPRRDRIVIREGMLPLNSELHLKAVLNELGSRNYQTSATSEADLWVAVYVLMRANPEGNKGGSASSPQREGSGKSHRGGGRGGATSGGASLAGIEGATYKNLMVIVQLEDRKTGHPVWQGEANFSAKDKAQDGTPFSIEAAVHQLMQPLPTHP
jgi:hypothetical protein